MAKQSNLPSETIMYSINPSNGALLVHHLPWSRTSPQLERYVAKGFTFTPPDMEPAPIVVKKLEAPVVVKSVVEPNTCSVCGKVCKSEFGLRSHMRSHKGK